MDPNYRNPVTEEFNGGYAWSINPKMVFEAEYVHVLGLHQNKTINLDPKFRSILTTSPLPAEPDSQAGSSGRWMRRLQPPACRCSAAFVMKHLAGVRAMTA